MHLIIGLGNPGSEYFNTRHNFGFSALNYFQDSLPGFSAWQTKDQFKALISEGQIDPPAGGEKILLVKPRIFMNNSGQAVKLLVDFYKLATDDIIVLHDDLDLALGQLRISQNASAGGHKGVASVIKELGTQNFTRLRLGIKSPSGFLSSLFKKFTPAEKFVLRKFSEEERPLVQQATQKTKEAILLILQEGLPAAQNKFN